MILAGVLVGTLWAAGQALGGSGPAPGGSGGHRYRVQTGDTLWAIARREVGPEGDPRPLVADIRESNGLGNAVLMPGQTLIVPGT
jgi:nucleoid-associated protein YgaU